MLLFLRVDFELTFVRGIVISFSCAATDAGVLHVYLFGCVMEWGYDPPSAGRDSQGKN